MLESLLTCPELQQLLLMLCAKPQCRRDTLWQEESENFLPMFSMWDQTFLLLVQDPAVKTCLSELAPAEVAKFFNLLEKLIPHTLPSCSLNNVTSSPSSSSIWELRISVPLLGGRNSPLSCGCSQQSQAAPSRSMEGGPNVPTVFVTLMGGMCELAIAFAPLVLLSLVDKGTAVYLADTFPKAHKGICTGLIKANVTLPLCFIRFLKKLKENPT